MATCIRIAENKQGFTDHTRFRRSKKGNVNPVRYEQNLDHSGMNGDLRLTLLQAGPDHPVILNDRYQLEEYLGAGGMGMVYKARDLKHRATTNPYIAIKILSRSLRSDPDAESCLQNEMQILKRIEHPNIIRAFGCENDQGIGYMMMEYIKGQTLDKLLKRSCTGGLPSHDACKLIEALAMALIQVHSQQIIHSDLKPANVLVTEQNVPKLIDFGLSQVLDKSSTPGKNKDDQIDISKHELAAFTPSYASLEILEGCRPGVRDDVFALGCIAYELVAGIHPYQKIPADQAEIQGLKPARIPHLKKHQWMAIKRAIALRKEKRTPTARYFYQEMFV